MAKMEVDGDLVRKLAALLEETGLSELEYTLGEERIRVSRATVQPAPPPTTAVTVAAPAPALAAATPQTGAEAEAEAGHPGAVKAPMVGVAYLSPEPGAPNFISVGDTVTKDQTLLLIEAMKTFNPVQAPRAGQVTRILVENAGPVEFGEDLVVLE